MVKAGIAGSSLLKEFVMTKNQSSDENSNRSIFSTALRWYLSGSWISALAFAVAGGLVMALGQTLTGQKDNVVAGVIGIPLALPFLFKGLKLAAKFFGHA